MALEFFGRQALGQRANAGVVPTLFVGSEFEAQLPTLGFREAEKPSALLGCCVDRGGGNSTDGGDHKIPPTGWSSEAKYGAKSFDRDVALAQLELRGTEVCLGACARVTVTDSVHSATASPLRLADCA